MKIIDLLNKIANGEIDRNTKYKFSDNDYGTINDFFTSYIVDDENLNLEIIEEKKIPEKINDINSDFYVKDCYYERLSKEEIALDLVSLKNWINSIIDYLKSKGE